MTCILEYAMLSPPDPAQVKGKDENGSWDLSWWEARIDSFNPATKQYVIEYEQVSNL